VSFGLELSIAGDLRKTMESRAAVAAGGLHKAAGIAANVVKERYRAEVRRGGLGDRLANTVRGVVYPRSATTGTMSPSAFVYTKAPKIIGAYATGATIRTVKGGVYLWIPTENVPGLGRGHKRMTPTQVEERFGDFEFVKSLTRPGTILAVVPAVRAKNNTSWRKASKGRTTGKLSRNAQRIVMFILVRQVSLRKRMDLEAVKSSAANDWPEIAGRALAEAFRNDSGAA
jgi:hypothetical protein